MGAILIPMMPDPSLCGRPRPELDLEGLWIAERGLERERRLHRNERLVRLQRVCRVLRVVWSSVRCCCPEHERKRYRFLFLFVRITLMRWPNGEIWSGEYRECLEHPEIDRRM